MGCFLMGVIGPGFSGNGEALTSRAKAHTFAEAYMQALFDLSNL